MFNLNEKYFSISERCGRNHQNKFCLRLPKRRFCTWELTVHDEKILTGIFFNFTVCKKRVKRTKMTKSNLNGFSYCRFSHKTDSLIFRIWNLLVEIKVVSNIKPRMKTRLLSNQLLEPNFQLDWKFWNHLLLMFNTNPIHDQPYSVLSQYNVKQSL